MSHWSEQAQQSANQSMGNKAPDAPVKDCETRAWEPLVETTELPAWQPKMEILGRSDAPESATADVPAPGATVTNPTPTQPSAPS